MGTFNTLHCSLTCPRCGSVVETEIECFFGNTSQMIKLTIGDRYPWTPGRQPKRSGRPEHGDTDGEGYMECPRCGKDAFLRVLVRDDVVTGVEPDTDRPGYIPD